MIKVILWGEEVGRLLWDERRHLSYFTFNPDFLSKGIDIAPLTAPIGDIGSRMPVYGASERIYQKLPPFIGDRSIGSRRRRLPLSRNCHSSEAEVWAL